MVIEAPFNIVESRGGKEKLLAAADALFSSRGYREVSVAEILNLGGVKAPSLYHHFGDKEGLYASWLQRAVVRGGEALQEAVLSVPEGASPWPAICDAMSASPGVDFLQPLKDRHEITDTRRRQEVEKALKVSILCRLVDLMPGASAELRAQLALHTLMFNHPNYCFSCGKGDSDRRAFLIKTLERIAQG